MLSQLEGKVTILKIAAGRWIATMQKSVQKEHKHCLGAAIGQLVAVTCDKEPGIYVELWIFFKTLNTFGCRCTYHLDCQWCRRWKICASICPRWRCSAAGELFGVRWKPGMLNALQGCRHTICNPLDCDYWPLHGHWNWLHTRNWVATLSNWSLPGKIEILSMPHIIYFIWSLILKYSYWIYFDIQNMDQIVKKLRSILRKHFNIS